MDAAGKDSTIEHVMTGVNPQGVSVVSFKGPSSEELDHTFLWRIQKNAPERGRIGIFNRSQYEEVIALQVHPEWLEKQALPGDDRGPAFWAARHDDLNAWEHHLDRNGTKVVKLFLHVSKAEQKKRFMARLDNPDKHVEVQRQRRHRAGPLGRVHGGLRGRHQPRPPRSGRRGTSCPADNKHVLQALTVAILVDTIEALDLQYPTVSDKDRERNAEARRLLEAEPS